MNLSQVASIKYVHNAPLDIPLAAQPLWLSALSTDSGSLWMVAFADGQVQGFRITAGTVTEEFALQHAAVPTTLPRLLFMPGKPELFTRPDDADPLSVAVPLPDLNQWSYVATNGDLVIWADGAIARLPIQALPDTHILVDEQSRLLLLAKPTTRYSHGILGDTLEPSAVLLIETMPILRVITTIEVAEPKSLKDWPRYGWILMGMDSVRSLSPSVMPTSVHKSLSMKNREKGRRLGRQLAKAFAGVTKLRLLPLHPQASLSSWKY